MPPEEDQNKRKPAEPQYLTRRDLAVRSSLSASTVQRYKEQNLIPYFQPGGKGARVLFPLNAIEAAIAAATSEKPNASNIEDQANQTSVTSRRPILPGPRPRWQSNLSSNRGD
jgi:hypothetical protein